MDLATPAPFESRRDIAARRAQLARIAAAIFVPLGLILLLFVLMTEFRRGEKLRGVVDRSYEARLTVERVLSIHQDIETGQRGYVLTGSAQFLAPYHAGLEEIEGALDRLAATTVRPREADNLRALSRAQRRFVVRMVALRRAGDRDRAEAEIAAGGGKRIMDAIRRHIAHIDAAEQQILQRRIDQARAAQRRSQWLTFGILALMAAMLLAAFVSNRRITRARKEAMARVEEQTQRLIAIFRSATDGIVTLNESGSIETINPAAAHMFGYEPDALLRRDIGSLLEVAPDQGEAQSFLARLRRRRSDDAGQVQEIAGKRSDGSIFPTDVALSPVIFADGKRYLAIIRDATERKQVEQMKSEFVSTVSHELRTPLTSIAGSLGLLSGGAAGQLPDRAARLISIAHGNSERLVRLINDILDIEKIESGKMKFDITDIALAPLIEQAIHEQAASAAAQDVTLAQGPEGSEARVYADADRLMQVLTNLLSNAIKFSPPGGTVRIETSQLDRRYRISVRDEGPGIPDEFRGRIFSKFAQADSTDTRQKGGTGLGLSIVREIVNRLGGAVSFDSSPGEGTSFHVDIPAAGLANLDRVDSEPLGDGGGVKLLHVEDDPDMLRLVASAFEGQAQVYSTPSVEEARASILRHDFDAVILDIGMADGSGLELIPLIRERQQGTPVILFTAQDVNESIAANVDGVLIKSRSGLDRLTTLVEQLLPGKAEA